MAHLASFVIAPSGGAGSASDDPAFDSTIKDDRFPLRTGKASATREEPGLTYRN